MADTDEDTTTQTAPPAAALPPGMSADQVNQVIQQYHLMPDMPARDTTPVKQGFMSLLGEALSGQTPVAGLTPAERDAAGRAASMNFFTGLMAASRYQPGQTVFSNLAEGFRGAQRGELGSEAQAMNYLGAQQDWALKQQQAHLEALKTALPFLQMGYAQQAARGQIAALGGNQPGAAPGGPVGGGGSYLTGDINKDKILIPQHESGGDPTALNYVARADPTAFARGATASGKYQFTDSTWKEGLQLAGLDPNSYAHAMNAPEKVQDKVFDAVYGKYGTKPWDPTQWKQNWVQGPGGKYTLQPTTGGPPAAPAPPAPFKVAGPTVAPPSASTAPAAGNLPVPPIPPPGAPVGGLGLVKNPDGTVGTPGGGFKAPVTTAAAPPGPVAPATTTTPPAQPTPQPTTMATPPPGQRTAYTGDADVPDPHSLNASYPPFVQPASTVRFPPESEAAYQAHKTQLLGVMQSSLPGTDIYNKAFQDLADLNKQHAQDITTHLTKAQTTETKTAQENYALNAKAWNDAHQAFLQSGLDIDRLQRQADVGIAQKDIEDRQSEATKASQVIPIVQQMQAQLASLPKGAIGTAVAAIDPNGLLRNELAKLGIGDSSQATAAQMLVAARNYLSLMLKPPATGALRNQEMDNLKSFTPGELNTPQAQQEMTARLLAYQRRVIQEADFASNYFGRSDPNNPSQRLYDNRGLQAAINAPVKYDQNGNITGGGLGPVVPEPPPISATDAEHSAYVNYIRKNVQPGMPYQTWEPKTDSNGNIQRDANGKAIPQRVTKVMGSD